MLWSSRQVSTSLFQYSTTPFIRKSLEEAKYAVEYIAFFAISPDAAMRIKQGCDEERFQKYLKLLSPDANLESDHIRSSFVSACRQAEKYLDGTATLEVRHLKKAHEILLRRTIFEENGGKFSEQESPTGRNLDTTYRSPKGEERDKSLKSFIRFINTNKTHPEILKPWLVYYYFDLIRPFESMNYAFSLVLLNHLMTKAFPNVPWFFEKFIFESWESHKGTTENPMFGQLLESRKKQNLTSFVQQVLELTSRNLNWVKEMVSSIYLEEKSKFLESPKQRNSLNFLMDRGFKLNHSHISELNNRQQKILEQVALNRDVNTKTLVQLFRCDRKTIQRDFAELMEFDLIKQEGKTKTVRYLINFSSQGKKIAPALTEATDTQNK